MNACKPKKIFSFLSSIFNATKTRRQHRGKMKKVTVSSFPWDFTLFWVSAVQLFFSLYLQRRQGDSPEEKNPEDYDSRSDLPLSCSVLDEEHRSLSLSLPNLYFKTHEKMEENETDEPDWNRPTTAQTKSCGFDDSFSRLRVMFSSTRRLRFGYCSAQTQPDPYTPLVLSV